MRVQVEFSISVIIKGSGMSFRLKHILIMIVAILCCLPVQVWAEIPTPRIKPSPPKLSEYLGTSEASSFKTALNLASRRRWSSFEAQQKHIKDPVARDVLIWIKSMKDPEVSFKDLTYVVHQLSDWPRMTGIQAKAEDHLFKKPIGANDTIAWFSGREPGSGEGRAAPRA